jgi:hypothetical protein
MMAMNERFNGTREIKLRVGLNLTWGITDFAAPGTA